jgi:hypothetical protein
MKMKLLLLAWFAGILLGRAVPPEFRVTDGGLEVERVSPDCPMLYGTEPK